MGFATQLQVSEPNPRTSRLALAGGLVAAIAVASAGFFIGRGTISEAVAPPRVLKPPPSAIPPAEVLDTYDRVALLALANHAADAFAKAEEMPAEVIASAGRRFDLVIPFGCEGPSELKGSTSMRWHYDADSATLRASVTPEVWSAMEWGYAGHSNVEIALQGFWIERPWTSATDCIVSSAQGGPSVVGSPDRIQEDTLAIAGRVADNSKNKARSFEIVRRVSAEDVVPWRGFRLRILGRISAQSGVSPISCVQPSGRASRPQCVISATFSELRIENPSSGKVLGAWPIADVAPDTE